MDKQVREAAYEIAYSAAEAARKNWQSLRVKTLAVMDEANGAFDRAACAEGAAYESYEAAFDKCRSAAFMAGMGRYFDMKIAPHDAAI